MAGELQDQVERASMSTTDVVAETVAEVDDVRNFHEHSVEEHSTDYLIAWRTVETEGAEQTETEGAEQTETEGAEQTETEAPVDEPAVEAESN
jgi:hypothetical protein